MDPAAPKLGFAIRFRLTDGLGEDGALELWDDFLAGLVEGRGLACDPAVHDFDGLGRLLYRHDASATEDDRRAVREWARRRGEIADYDVGPLMGLIQLPSCPVDQLPS
ncbi:MAG TPA: 50S ribosome-binding protein YggL [Gemmatimonadaceae bacterium]|nr:50S ribosome-binding protein YggL [Gemmatimonadaceae bacterium]